MSTFMLLSITLLSASFGAPYYLYLRGKMTRDTVHQDQETSFYKLTRAARTTVYLFIMGLLSLGVLGMLFYTVLSRQDLYAMSLLQWLVIGCYGLVSFMIVFGMGVYASAIVSEQFTLNSLKEMEAFIPLKRVNDFYHGPFSHLLVFGGVPLLFWCIAATEVMHPLPEAVSPTRLTLFGVYGVYGGLLYAMMQVFNYTWRYQRFVAFPLLLGYGAFLWWAMESWRAAPFALFFGLFLVSYNLGLGLYSWRRTRTSRWIIRMVNFAKRRLPQFHESQPSA